MDSVEDRIGEFFRRQSETTHRKEYFRFDPEGPFTYFCSPDELGLLLLAEQVTGPKVRNQLGSYLIRAISLAPSSFQFIPKVHRTLVSVPDVNPFSFGVTTSRQITLLSPKKSQAATVGWEGEARVTTEIETRKRIPESVNVPEMIEADTEFPYFVTEYIDGSAIKDPVSDWQHVLNALTQLQDWYQSNTVEWIESCQAISQLRDDLEEISNDEIIQNAFQQLERLQMPEQIAWGITHGDLHGQNLRVRNGDVYILDWERAGERFLHSDFILPFLQWVRYGGNSTIFKDLIKQRNSGEQISNQYAQRVGPTVWNESKWHPGIVIFGLLRDLVIRSQHVSGWKRTYRTLSEILPP